MKPMRKGKVLCVGRTYCDLLFAGVPKFPTAGEEIYSESFEIHAGGGAFITAAYLAASGVETALCSVLPTGPIGKEVMQQINRSSVDLSYCDFASDDEEPQITVVISSSDDRSFLTNRSGASVPASISKALEDPELVHLHIAELATLAENPDLARAAKNRGISVSLDCSWDEKLLGDRSTLKLLESVDVFLPNEKEVRALLGLYQPLNEISAEISSLAPEVVVKQGAGGATLFSNGSVIPSNAVSANFVDSTGAGDAFNAGFISAWLNGNVKWSCFSGQFCG